MTIHGLMLFLVLWPISQKSYHVALGKNNINIVTSLITTERKMSLALKMAGYETARIISVEFYQFLFIFLSVFNLTFYQTFECLRSSYLKEHEISHTSGKPFSCSQQTYECLRSSYLKEHDISHAFYVLGT